MDALLILVTLLTIAVYLIYALSKKKFDYWEKKNVPYSKPLPIFGNYARFILMKNHHGYVMQKLCQKFPKAPYFGAFFGTEPVLIIQSPEVLKHVLTKNFYQFNGREISDYATQELITEILFFTGGDRWKVVRTNLTPLFSISKVKNMFHLIEKCCHMFEDTLVREIKVCDVIEMKDFCTRFTMDCLCSCSFGIESNALLNPENNPFKFMGDEIFRATKRRGLKLIIRSIWPAIFYGLGFKCYPTSIATFFSGMLKDILKSRNYKPSERNDFVDQILTWNNKEFITCATFKNTKTDLEEKREVKLKVDYNLILVQCMQFFGAGFETSATTMGFTLFELAKNQEAQKRAAEEIDEFLHRHGNKINYECVNELPYVEACMNETLRLYPVMGFVTREVMEDCTLPDGLHLDKGIRVHIPVYHLHHDPAYFPEPEEYKPERFLFENKKNVKPYTFLPFGEGPRNCIGKRFAVMQVFAGLISFLKTYRVELAEGMSKTLTLDARTLITQPKDMGLMMKVYKREGWEERMFLRTQEQDRNA